MNKKMIVFFILFNLILINCRRKNTPPEIPQLFGPTKVGKGAEAEYKALTFDSDGDSVRYHFSWDNKKETTKFYVSGETAKIKIIFDEPNTYFLKSRAEDSKGAFSEWSSPLVIEVIDNQKPTCPSLQGPSWGLINTYYKFTAMSYDPDSDSIRYKFIWGDGRETTTDWVASGTPCTESISYVDTGTYVIKVVAQDNKYAWSDTSAPLEFRVKKEYEPGEIIFIFRANDEIISSPAISVYNKDTLVIFGDNDGNLYAISAASGVLKYRGKALIPGEEFVSSPVIGPDGTIYIASTEGRVYAFAPNLTVKWVSPESMELGLEGIVATPVVSANGDRLFVGSENETLYCFSTLNGEILWKFKLAGSIQGSCIIDNEGNLYVGERDHGYFYKFSPHGESLWAIYLGAPVYGQGAIGNNYVYVTTRGKVYAISFDGRIVYTATFRDTNNEVYGGPLIGWDDKVIVATEDGYIEVFEPNLVKVYDYQKNPGIYSTPCLAGSEEKILYFNNDNGEFYAINPLTPNGSEYFMIPLYYPSLSKKLQADFLSSPVVGDNGIVYVAYEEYLFAIVGHNRLPLANTLWPMFQRDQKHSGRIGGKR